MALTTRHLLRGLGALVCLALAVAMVPGPSAAGAARPPSAPERAVPTAPVPVYITTEGGVPITSRDDYVNGVMLLDGVHHAMEIRGRGNSTWTWPKKPYKIKLANDVALLGTEPRDEWVLLANYADRSALRTYLAMGLAASSGLPWTPRTRFVDVGEAAYVVRGRGDRGGRRRRVVGPSGAGWYGRRERLANQRVGQERHNT